MNLNHENSKIYDVLFFGCIYFNSSKFLDKCSRNKFNDPEKYLEFYNEASGSVKEVPNSIAPFFHTNSYCIPLVLEFFVARSEKKVIKKDEFIDIIKSGRFRDFSCKYYMEDPAGPELSEDYSGIIDEIKFMLENYETVRQDFIDYVQSAYEVISDVHDRNAEIINASFETAQLAETKILFSKYCKTGLKETENSYVSFSLMDKYILLYDYTGEQIDFLLGINFIEPLTNEVPGINVSYKHFLQVCSGSLRIEILETLHKYGELTVSELCNTLFTSTSTMLRHVNDMFYQSVLVISRLESIKIYYTVNKEYFKLLKGSMNEFIDRLEK